MSDEKDYRVVFRTSQPDEAPTIAGRLADADIPFEIRIVVQESREAQAIGLIEAHMQSIGAAPHEDKPETDEEKDGLLPCPNCEAVGLAMNKPCAGCGFAIRPLSSEPPLVQQFSASAHSFCPECRDPLTFRGGKCAACGEELEPLENGDRLCPELNAHVLYRDTEGGAVCKACRAVWVDLA